MATYLPSSGALSISAINSVFGRGNNLNAYRGTTYYTSSAGPYTFSSGAISMSSFYGTGPDANTFSFTISSNQTNANLRSLAVSAGWNQSSAVIATIASGIYIYSTSTGTPGLTINGSWPGGVTLVNNGYIMGMGGSGGNNGASGFSGGDAISLGLSVSITNNSYIGGGGGGGGGSGSYGATGGGGAGGGPGSSPGSTLGGAGGGPGSAGSNGGTEAYKWWYGGGGGGGRIMPGTGGGTSSSSSYAGKGGGAGGGGGAASGFPYSGGAGGSAGNAALTNGYMGAGGGGWGASGGTSYQNGPTRGAGSGGKAVALNGYSVTWNATGTRYGAIS